MTIKRRLFLSNILMLVMPIFITMLMFSCVIFILLGLTGYQNVHTFRDRSTIYDAIEQVKKLSHEDIPEIDRLNHVYIDDDIAISLYKGDTLIHPSGSDTSHLIQIALLEEGDFFTSDGSNAVFSTRAGEYTLVIAAGHFTLDKTEPFRVLNDYVYMGALIFVLSIMIVFLTNRILTHYVLKRVLTPIDVLVSGVHEIRDGNLDFRLEYNYEDEFSAVCSDFNDMAARLSDMVTQRLKDENNRKELIASISHDLRTPLTSIKAYIEGLEKGVASTPQRQKKYLDTIKGKTNELEHTIHQLFLFSKLDIGEYPFLSEPVDIGEELSRMIAGFQDEHPGICVALTENVRDACVEVDVMQFRNVVYNILENSMKYKRQETVTAEISCRKAGHHVLISIADDGPGVSDAALGKLFDVFYREDSSRQNSDTGSGLGLAIAAKTIERLGGTIGAENDGGLRINITLPLYKGACDDETNPNC